MARVGWLLALLIAGCGRVGFDVIADAVDAPPPEPRVYLKASNAEAGDLFGIAVALSRDGSSLVVGALFEDGNGNAVPDSGAAYVFRRAAGVWSEEAYIKPSITDRDDEVGDPVALSDDGNTLVVTARSEASAATGIDGDATDNSAPEAGAVYVFGHGGSGWTQQAYLKASNTSINAEFGYSAALSGDGSTIAVSQLFDSSGASGIDGNANDTSAPASGAVFVFVRAGSSWVQQAYIKEATTRAGDELGYSVALSTDGSTLAVGAVSDDSVAIDSGAVYVFSRAGSTWSQQAFLKSAVPNASGVFGAEVAVSGDGNTISAQAIRDVGMSSGVTIFRRTGQSWVIDGHLADLTPPGGIGAMMGFSFDGSTLLASAPTAANGGTAFVFARGSSSWNQTTMLVPSDPDMDDQFGAAAAISSDGTTIAIGAPLEDSSAQGIDGDQTDNSASNAGAVYVFQ